MAVKAWLNGTDTPTVAVKARDSGPDMGARAFVSGADRPSTAPKSRVSAAEVHLPWIVNTHEVPLPRLLFFEQTFQFFSARKYSITLLSLLYSYNFLSVSKPFLSFRLSELFLVLITALRCFNHVIPSLSLLFFYSTGMEPKMICSLEMRGTDAHPNRITGNHYDCQLCNLRK